MISKRGKREIVDVLHRAYVRTMIGFTGVGLMFVGLNLYTMFENAKNQEKLRLAQLEIKDDPDEFPSSNPIPGISSQ